MDLNIVQDCMFWRLMLREVFEMVEVVKISVGKVEELVNDLVARIDKT